jgi:hypothetical protein
MRASKEFFLFGPPPLTPPLKGEGDYVGALSPNFLKVSTRKRYRRIPLPLEGRG